MTDNETIKALGCCSTASCISKQCPYEKTHDIPKCTTKLTKEALDLINRLQAEKEALIAGQETLQKALAEKTEEVKNQSQNFAVLVSDHRALQQSFDNLKNLYEAEKAKVEKAKEKFIYFAKELQKAKVEIARLRKYDEERDIRLHAKLTATARAEAIKEFAERLNDKAFHDMNDGEANNVISIPAKDIVEVVRCKDCVYFVSNNLKYCNKHIDCWGSSEIYVDDDDFCSYGERLEADGDKNG